MGAGGAGEVVAIGSGVTRVAIGDRVAAAMFPRWIAGRIDWEYAPQLGGSVDGMMTEFIVLSEDALVPIPDHLSFEEAATLPCAAVTAWNALTGARSLQAGETVLALGFGGVPVAGWFSSLRPLDLALSLTDGRADDKAWLALGCRRRRRNQLPPHNDRSASAAARDLYLWALCRSGRGNWRRYDGTVHQGHRPRWPDQFCWSPIRGCVSDRYQRPLQRCRHDPRNLCRKS